MIHGNLLEKLEALLKQKEVPYMYKSRFEYEVELRKKIEYIKKKEKIKYGFGLGEGGEFNHKSLIE